MKAELQQNDGVNIIVETAKSTNSVSWHKNISVDISESLTDEQIREAYKQHYRGPTIEDMKNKLRSIEGFAKLNCSDPEHKISDLVTYSLVS